MAYRPRIGLTMRLEIETRRFYLGRDYSEAVEAAGGLPVHVPLIPRKDYISALVDELDGILLPGCDTDVDPRYYGEDPHPKLRTVVPEKDETDLLVIQEAERRNLPVFGICYGMQVLNVSRGGSLIQDIESQIENPIKHSQGKPLDRYSHSVQIDNESMLASIVGDALLDHPWVNSHHHQAVGKVGRDLRAIAWANDGVIEGIQDTRPDRFVLGVQWHPELRWDSDPISRAIFGSFIASCRERAGEGERKSSVDLPQVLTV